MGLNRTATQMWSLPPLEVAVNVVAARLLVLLCRESTPGVAGREAVLGREPPVTSGLGIRKVLVKLSDV